MTYHIIISAPLGYTAIKEAGGLQEARDLAVEAVHERMEAFGDDQEALTAYGFFTAEAKALDMPEDGGTIFLQDGWKIEVINDDDSQND